MRYFQPKEYQYVSQYTPEMAAMDYKKGQDLLKQEDEFQKNLFDAKNKYHILEGTYSKKEDVDAANQHIQTNLDAVSKDFNSGKINASDATNRIGMLANYFNTNKNIQGLWNEGQNTLNIDRKRMAENSLTNAVNGLGPNAFSFDGKNLTSKKFNKEELADLQPMLHNYIQEGDFTKFTNEVLQQLKPNIVKEDASKEGLSISYKTLPDGTSIPFYTNIDGTRVTKGVLEQKVRPLIKNWIKANHDNSNLQQVLFSKFLNQNDEQSKQTLEDRMVQTYTGYFTDIEDNTRMHSTPLGGTGEGKKKGDKEEKPKPEIAVESSTTISGSKIKYTNAKGEEYDLKDPMKFEAALKQNKEVIKQKVTDFQTSLSKTYPGVKFNIDTENNSDYIVPVIPPSTNKALIPQINAAVVEANKNVIENGIKQAAAERALIDVKTVWKNQYEKDLGPINNIVLNKYEELEAMNDKGIDNYKYYVNVDKPNYEKVVTAFDQRIKYFEQFTDKDTPVLGDKTARMMIMDLKKGKKEFETTFYNNLQKVNPAYATYTKLVQQATDNISYNNQTLLALDATPVSDQLKNLMYETLTSKERFIKDVVNADSNTSIKSLSDDLKDSNYLKIVEESIKKNAKVFYNKETNTWDSYVELPNKDSSKGNHKLIIKQDSQAAIADYAENHGFDYNFYKLQKEHDYYSSINDAGFGMIKSSMIVDDNADNIADTEFDYRTGGVTAKSAKGLNLITQQVKVNTSYIDKSTNNKIPLEKGDTIFEIPELPQTQNLLFKTSNEKDLMRFHQDLDYAINKNDEAAINQILSSINTYGITPINNPKAFQDFDRDRKLNYEAPVKVTLPVREGEDPKIVERTNKIKEALRKGWVDEGTAGYLLEHPKVELSNEQLKTWEDNYNFKKKQAEEFYKKNAGK